MRTVRVPVLATALVGCLALLVAGSLLCAEDAGDLMPPPPNLDDILQAAPPPQPLPPITPMETPPETTPESFPETTPEAFPPTGFAPAYPTPAEGLRGTVRVGALHARTGPDAERYEIVTTVKQGTELAVLGENNGWLCVAYPPQHPCYLRREAIDGVVPETIPPSGVPMPVRGETNLYVRDWEKNTVVGVVQAGEIVTILARRGTFYAVVAPPSAHAWVSAKYVDLSDPSASLQVVEAPVPGAGAQYGQAPTPKPAPVAKVEPPAPSAAKEPVPGRIPFGRVMGALQEEEVTTVVTEAPMEEVEARRLEWEAVERELAAIRAETERHRAAILQGSGEELIQAEAKTEMREEVFTGWVEYIGFGLRRPAAFRLIKGGEILFLLRSDNFDLKKNVNEYVAVGGQVQLAPGYEANVLVVDRLTVLDTGDFGGEGAEKSPAFLPVPLGGSGD
ncbi:MAG: SH3 domain-containing protein [Planctomycetota bacterium]